MSGRSTLPVNTWLRSGEWLTSPNGKFCAYLDESADLKLIWGSPDRPSDWRYYAYWSKGVSCPHDSYGLVVQPDGNFCCYRLSNGTPVFPPMWHTDTALNKPDLSTSAGMQDDGNFCLRSDRRPYIWGTSTALREDPGVFEICSKVPGGYTLRATAPPLSLGAPGTGRPTAEGYPVVISTKNTSNPFQLWQRSELRYGNESGGFLYVNKGTGLVLSGYGNQGDDVRQTGKVAAGWWRFEEYEYSLEGWAMQPRVNMALRLNVAGERAAWGNDSRVILYPHTKAGTSEDENLMWSVRPA
jgi:hypothetical protein